MNKIYLLTFALVVSIIGWAVIIYYGSLQLMAGIALLLWGNNITQAVRLKEDE